MDLFTDILTRVTLPIITLVALGWLLQGRLKLDVPTLNRIQVYVVMPAFLIHFLSSGQQPLSVIWPVVTFGVIQFAILIPLGWLLVIFFRQRRSLGPIMGLGTAYANVGFFGIPVTQLAFGDEYLIHQSVLTALMAVLVCTVGVALMAPPGGSRLAKLKTAFETPLIPSVVIGLPNASSIAAFIASKPGPSSAPTNGSPTATRSIEARRPHGTRERRCSTSLSCASWPVAPGGSRSETRAAADAWTADDEPITGGTSIPSTVADGRAHSRSATVPSPISSAPSRTFASLRNCSAL